MRVGGVFQLAALISSALTLHLPRQSNGTGYSVKTPPLDTPWYVTLAYTVRSNFNSHRTYEVGTNPWPQYPRPLLQRSAWQTLNGVWTYQNASSKDAVNSPPFGQTLSQSVLVPSCLESGLSGECISLDCLQGVTTHSPGRHSRILYVVQLVFHLLQRSFELVR